MNNEHILVVDDIEQNRYMLEFMLRQQGASVETAAHGVEALQKLREQPFHLIISDILMPVMDGYQFCRACKSDPELRDIPFVFYTATYTTDEDRRFALDLGASRFIIKPQEPDKLLAMLEEILVSHRAGALPSVQTTITDESQMLKRYNHRLIHKLEDKLVELQETNQRLQEEIAQRKELDARLLRAQKMEAIGTLVSGVAHNFNNVLVGVLGKAYLAKSRLDRDPEYVRTQLEEIEQLTNHAAEIVRQLMNYARKETPAALHFDFRKLVEETVNTVRIGIPSHTVLEREIAREELPVHGDRTQLQQVVMNLINNARDAVAEAETRTLRVALRRLTVTAESRQTEGLPSGISDGEWIALSIEDSGCGISEAHLQRIFDPFFTTKEQGKGTGLGLSTAHSIIENHNGFICCHSVPGEGTRFNVYLPIAPEEESAACDGDGDTDTPMKGSGETILLAEDEEAVRSTTTALLERLGYRVLAATDGREAVFVSKDVVFTVSGGLW